MTARKHHLADTYGGRALCRRTVPPAYIVVIGSHHADALAHAHIARRHVCQTCLALADAMAEVRRAREMDEHIIRDRYGRPTEVVRADRLRVGDLIWDTPRRRGGDPEPWLPIADPERVRRVTLRPTAGYVLVYLDDEHWENYPRESRPLKRVPDRLIRRVAR
ncbi:MAG: hypothetical protein OXN95_15025 [bacterium]|nr:hypothetical protein [bacterium]